VKHKSLIYLIPTAILFITISSFWVINRVNNLQIIYLLLGFIIGIFFLDIDHLLYWFFIKPNSEESRLIKLAIKNKAFKSVIKIIQKSHKTHFNLIFHHYFFQVIITLFSLFILNLTTNAFISSFLLSINLHLIIDEIYGYKSDPKTVQKWLFAREPKTLSSPFLKKYIAVFITFNILFTFLLIRSKI
jgi:hypothetical protein